MVTTNKKYLVELDLGEAGGRHRIKSIDHLLRWLETEVAYWNWLSTRSAATIPHLAQLGTHVIQQLNALRGQVNTWQQRGGTEATAEGVPAAIENLYKVRQLLHSSTAEAKFIQTIRNESGDIAAAAALASTLLQSPQQRQAFGVDYNNLDQYEGKLAITLFRRGIAPKSAAAVQRSLKTLSENYRQVYEEQAAAADELTGRLKGLDRKYTKITDRGSHGMAEAVRLARRHAKKQRSKANDEWEDQKKAHMQSVADLEDNYNKAFALEKPVEYWDRKRKKHRLASSILFVSFAFYLIGVVKLVGFALTTPLGSTEFWKDPSPGFLAAAAVTIGVVVALGRIPLRLAMSQLHLGNDADERVTMVTTYLALREGEHASEQHMSIVLERLFTPAADGIVKDDLGPVTVIDHARTLFDKGRR